MTYAGDKGTVSIELVHEALKASIERGVDVSHVLEKSNIDSQLLDSPKSRVSASGYARLWSHLADQIDDEFFGMDSHAMRRGSFRLMCQAAVSTSDLRQALGRMLTFLGLVLDDLKGTLTCEGSEAIVTLDDHGTERRLFAYGTWFILVHGLACGLVKRRIPLKELKFRCPPPEDDSHYRTRFCEKVIFGSNVTEMRFDIDLLDLRINETPASLPEFLRDSPANLLVKYRNDSSTSVFIKRKLRSQSPETWPELEAFAKLLCISSTTLQRRLQSEGLNYQRLKDEFRRDIAIDLLSNGDLTIAEIAARTGFQETSAFYRAFKKWTGVIPGAYRRGPDEESAG